jgi:glycosyltransferase involved in cell wall biosynthesis
MSITSGDVEAFQSRYGLTPGRTALFLGGVDKAKGIDFLLESARQAERLLPRFVLLVGGAGQDLPKVRSAQAEGAPVRALGRLDGAEKALALRAADVLAIPEWIGLVAVDSLVAGRPVVSTFHPSHSPEHEYLVPGATAMFVGHSAGAYARAMTDLLDSGEQLAAMQENCVNQSAHYSLNQMIDNFVEGVLAWSEIRRFGRLAPAD